MPDMNDLRERIAAVREAVAIEEEADFGKPKAKKKAVRKSAVEPPQWETIEWPSFDRSIRLLCFDQTLAHTGWALLVVRSGVPVIEGYGTFDIVMSGSKDKAGDYDNMLRGDDLFHRIRGCVETSRPHFFVHELPAIKGWRTDSSKQAMCRVRDAIIMSGYGPARIFVVQAQHAKKVITGSGNAVKADVGLQVRKAYSAHGHAIGRTNENSMDAIALGLSIVLDGTFGEKMKEMHYA